VSVPRPRRHPLARLAGTVARLPRYLKLAQALARDPAVPARSKAALTAGVAYCLSPVDLIPGIVPVLGQLDDLGALLLGLRVALRSCPDAVAAPHLAAAGLTAATLDADLETVAATAAWLVGGAARLGARTARGGAWLLRRAGRQLRRPPASD
jgi:uncharacterized membrane protein YkvA (DUF1232 family)